MSAGPAKFDPAKGSQLPGFRGGGFTSDLMIPALSRCEKEGHHYLMQAVNASILPTRFVLLLALGSALGLTSAFAAGQLDSLLSNSPFGSAKSNQAADTTTQPLEFRGVLEENGQQVFSVYDTATKRSRWVGLNAANEDFVIKSYDAEAHTISLEQRGRVLALTLKSGPKVVQNFPQLPQPGMQPGANGQPGQILPNGAVGKGPEAQRLQQIADEIRRRRALRQQPPQMPNAAAPVSASPAPAPGAVPGPMLTPLPGATTAPVTTPPKP